MLVFRSRTSRTSRASRSVMLSRDQNGHVEPSIQTLNRLARALNVSEASLLGDQRAALEEFEKALNEHGIKLTSKDQARSSPRSWSAPRRVSGSS